MNKDIIKHHLKLMSAVDKIKVSGEKHSIEFSLRILELVDFIEDDDDNVFISVDSVNDSWKFLLSMPVNVKLPGITVSDDGLITLRWRKDSDHLLATNFLGVAAQFVIFIPKDDEVMRISEYSSVDDLWHIISLYGVEQWVLDDRKR